MIPPDRDPDAEAADALADDAEWVHDSGQVPVKDTVERIEQLGWEKPRLMFRESGQEVEELKDMTRLTFQSDPVSAAARKVGRIRAAVLLTPEALEDFDAGKIDVQPDIVSAVLDCLLQL